MRLILLFLLLTCVGCQIDQKTDVVQNSPIENPEFDAVEVYDFDKFENLLHKNDKN